MTQLKLLHSLVAGKHKYILITTLVILIFALYFAIKTKSHNPQEDFNHTKSLQRVATSETMEFLVRNSKATTQPKSVILFGKIDHNAVTITSSMSSVVKWVAEEGIKLKKGANVVTFINEVSRPMPFNGTLLDTFTKEGDDIKVGDKLFVAIPDNISTMSINLDIPVSYSNKVQQGTPVTFYFKEKPINGSITYISKTSEEDLGVMKAVAKTPFVSIPHNTVVKVFIEVSQHSTHFIPKTAIIIKGEKTSVKVVQSNNEVQEHEVEVVSENKDGFYIAGLENEARIIIRTPFYAQSGKKYKYLNEQI